MRSGWQRISTVMRWAVAEGHRQDNPAGEAIGAALPKNGHQTALSHADVADAIRKVRGSGADANSCRRGRSFSVRLKKAPDTISAWVERAVV